MPTLGVEDLYHVIIASDVIYDESHATVLPRCLARRLAKGGRCLIAQPIRFPVIFEQFQDNMIDIGLRSRVHHVDDERHYLEGVCGTDKYPGGFVYLLVDWADKPAPPIDWDGEDIPWLL